MTDITATITPEGDLAVTLTEDADRDELRHQLEERGQMQVLADLLEPYYTNGGYQPFDASDANPFVGITGAPCIAESMDTDDEGNNTIVGRLWYFPSYMLESPIEVLIEKGVVIWSKP